MVRTGHILFLILKICQYAFAVDHLVRATHLSDSPDVSDTPLDLHSLCPYSRFCHSPPLKNFTDPNLVSCCERCYCDPKCYEIGNCCPDVNLSPSKSLRYPCIDISTSRTYSLFYHVVDDCKDKTTAKLYPECFQPKELSDLVVVSDPSTGRVYKNKHCAKCHDVTNYVTWKLHVGCSDILNKTFQTLEERDRFLYENRQRCSVHSVPHGDTVGYVSRCSKNVINRCNETGLWDNFDHQLRAACHGGRPEQNTVFIERFSLIKYASVYCFLCNSAKQKVSDMCTADDFYTHTKTTRVKFAALLETSYQPNHDAVRRCTRETIWDPYSMLCRVVNCPGGTIPDYGQCESVVMYTEGIIFELFFEVELNTNISTIMDPTSFTLILSQKFTSMFNMKCRVASRSLYSIPNTDNLLLGLSVLMSRTCVMHTFIEQLRIILLKGPIKLLLRTQTTDILQFQLRLLLGKHSFDKLGFLESITLIFMEGTIKYIDASILLYCPSIRLTRSEALALGLDNGTTGLYNSSDPVPVGKNEDTQLYTHESVICVDKYFEALESLSSASLSFKIYQRLYFVLILMHLVKI